LALAAKDLLRVRQREAKKAIMNFERSLRLSPHDPKAHDSLSGMAIALIQLDRAAEAIPIARRAVQHNPNYPTAWRAVTAALALTGRMDEAHAALVQLFEVDPNCSLDTIQLRFGYSPQAQARYFEGLRRPECRKIPHITACASHPASPAGVLRIPTHK
jgi:Flp pilus assembly protein TadD